MGKFEAELRKLEAAIGQREKAGAGSHQLHLARGEISWLLKNLADPSYDRATLYFRGFRIFVILVEEGVEIRQRAAMRALEHPRSAHWSFVGHRPAARADIKPSGRWPVERSDPEAHKPSQNRLPEDE